MKRFGKFSANVLAAAILFSLGAAVGCGDKDNASASDGLQTETERQEAVFTVGYDYGLHVEGKATLLLGYCMPFFEPAEYALTPLLAGEELTLSHTGEMYIMETYPGQVFLQGKILSVLKTKTATVTEIAFQGIADGKITGNGQTFIHLPEFAVAKDNSLVRLDDLTAERTLFIAYIDGKTPEIQPTAIYLYDPFV